MFDPFERFLIVLVHHTAITVAPTHPTIVVEWIFQLRWSCASFLQTRVVPQLLPFADILVIVPMLVGARPERIRISRNGVSQDPFCPVQF